MKNLFTLFMFVITSLLSINTSYACVPSTVNCSGQFGAACPSNLPDATFGNAYNQVITLFIPATIDTFLPIIGTTTIVVDSVTFVGVSGLSSGLTYTINNGSKFYPTTSDTTSQYTCLEIAGTPCGGSQTVTFTINLLYDVFTPFGSGQIIQNYPVTYELISNAPLLEITSTLDYLCTSGSTGNSATLAVQSGFNSYEWSTTETTESITVNSAGNYGITITDGLGCTQEAYYQIALLEAGFSGNAYTICPNQILPLEAFGGLNFTWTSSPNLSATNISNPIVYDLTADASFGVSVSNGICSDDAVVTVTVSNNCVANCTTGTPDRSCTPPSGELAVTCPDNLPTMTNGVAYNTDVTFFFRESMPLEEFYFLVVGIPMSGLPQMDIYPDFIHVSGVVGLPSGLFWSCDQLSVNGGNCIYYPSLFPAITQYGAINICGIPCSESKTDTIKIILTITATIPNSAPFIGGSQQAVDIELPVAYHIENNNTLTITVNPAGIQPAGTPVTLSASTSGFSNFVWSNGATTSEIIVNDAGIYTVSANNGGCSESESVIVAYELPCPNIIVSGNVTNATVEGAANGTVSITLSNGTAPYTYAWSNGATTKNLTNIEAGNYTVTITDNNGCSASQTFIVYNDIVSSFLSDTDAVSIYPNPTAGEFVVIVRGKNQFEKSSIKVYDTQGKIVLEDKLSEKGNKFSLQEMPQGMYLIKIETASGNINKRLVKY